jgi:hypothetical protein
MKLNLLELKKWADIKTEYLAILNYCIDNWNNQNVKKSLEWETMTSFKFIKKDIIDLKEIEIFDEYLFEITVNLFFLKYLLKESESSNIQIDINKMSTLSEEEIRNLHNEDMDELANKNTIYTKSLKSYGFIQKNGTVDTTLLNSQTSIKREFISNALHIIRTYGREWNPDLENALISLDIIKE